MQVATASKAVLSTTPPTIVLLPDTREEAASSSVVKVIKITSSKDTVEVKAMAVVKVTEVDRVIQVQAVEVAALNVSLITHLFNLVHQIDLSLCLVDEDEVVKHAEQEGSGDRSLFTTAMGFLGSHQVCSASLIAQH